MAGLRFRFAFPAVIFGSGPAAAHLRQHKGYGWHGEDLYLLVRRSPEGEGGEGLSESGPVRSAGNEAKRHVRPARDDRNDRLLVSHAAQLLSAPIDRPVRDG